MTEANGTLQAALRFAQLGYSVFPCLPGAKAPLTKRGFHDASHDAEQIAHWWTQHPIANVALSTEGLVVVDVDGAANPWLAGDPVRKLNLFSAPTSLTAGGGRHHIFRQPADKHWRNTTGKLAEKVDTRGDGGYIVAPPSAIKDAGVIKPYSWLPGKELDVKLDDLPIPPSWLIEELDRVGKPAERHVPVPNTAVAIESSGPAICLSINANEIPTGQRNSTLARLAGAMRHVGMSQTEIAAALHQANEDRCIPPLPDVEVQRIAASIARYEPDQISVALAENHWAQMYAEEPAEKIVTTPDPGPIPESLLSVPGFIDQVIDYTLATAPYPQRTLAFCGALSLQAVLAGRKVRDVLDNRTNLYVLGLAHSGAGKDHPRKVNQRILVEAGLPSCVGDSFASGEGIEDRLMTNPSMLFQTDEIDALITKIKSAQDARYEGIISVLLKMFSSANALYPMRVKAGKESGVIDQPCHCIFGTAIPKNYYEALTIRLLSNGFFARMLIIEVANRPAGQDGALTPVPASVVSTARWWADFMPGGPHQNLACWHPAPKIVDHTPEAGAILQDFRGRADQEYAGAEDRLDEVGMAIWARAHEKARRLALIYACSADHTSPQITAAAAQWACAFVEHQTRRMLFMAGEHVSESSFDARCKSVVATLRKWRDKHGEWMPFWELNRRHPWTEREHDEVRKALVNQRLIEYQESPTGVRPNACID